MLLKRGVVKVLMCIKFMVLHIECPLKVYVDLKKKTTEHEKQFTEMIISCLQM